MPRKSTRELVKVTLNLYADDWEKLAELQPKLGPSRAVRELVHNFVRKVEEEAAQRSVTPPVELDQLV